MTVTNSTRVKQRWKDSEAVASRLGITKSEVYNYLLTVIIEKGWLQSAKNGDAEIIMAIRELPEWQRMQNPIRVMNEEEEEEKEKDMAISPGEKLNCAMWLIRKIGSFEEAKIALELAGQAIKKLSKRLEN